MSAAARTGRVDRDLRAIGSLTQAVLDGDDLETLLGRIAGEARQLADAASGVVVTVAGDSGLMTFRGVDGISVGPLRVGNAMPVRDTLTELALARGTPIVARTVSEIPPAGRAVARATGTGPLIAAPLASIGPARGAIVVARAETAPPFAPADVTLVSTFAAQAATAIELFELRSAETGAAASTERLRIAGELHDGIVATLRELQVAIGSLETGSEGRLGHGIRDVQTQLAAAIDAVDAYVLQLRLASNGAGPAASRQRSGPVSGGTATADKTAPATPRSRRGRSPGTIAVIGELARAAAADAPTADVLQALLEEVAARVDGSIGLIGTVTDDGENVLVRSRFGAPLPGRHTGDLLPIGDTLVGRAITAGRPVIVAPTEPPPGEIPPHVSALVGAVVIVPLAIRGQQFGAMAVGRLAGAPAFGQSDVNLIEAYGVQAAIALEFGRVRQEIRLGSVSIERTRIGHELHEHVIQRLFGVGMGLQALQTTVREPSVAAQLQAIVEALDRIIRDVRRFVFGLGPGPSSPAAADDRVDALAAENARLQQEIEVQLAEVRASRRRIIAAGDAERKRVERDLHDGAQQRLVSLTLALRLARSRLGEDLDPSARSSLDQASADARAALSELRELARGIHPQILTQAGLGPAVETLAARSPVEVTVEVTDSRFAAAVEGAAYFTISEGLANVAKYAKASRASVRVSQSDGHLRIEIADDGVGGADPAAGTGLRGLADRLDSIQGTLDVESPAGDGTRLVARIPVEAGSVEAPVSGHGQ